MVEHFQGPGLTERVPEDDQETLLGYYRTMLLIRRFEEKVDELFATGAIKGTTHLCAGQEAVAVGACAALRPEDRVLSNHRGHGHFIAKGGEPRRIMAELFGKQEGYSRGRGGSQHMADFAIGFLGSNGITGGTIPIATGAALSAKLQKQGHVTLVFFGEGASNQGTFHESLNMAAAWNLPVVYLCENNLYAMSTHYRTVSNIEHVAIRAEAYAMPGVIVDGNDVLAVRDVVRQAAERARTALSPPKQGLQPAKAGGPTLIEAKTYRYFGHSKSDLREYRTSEEEALWHDRDPIGLLGAWLTRHGLLDALTDANIRAEVDAVVEEAVQFAQQAPVPPADEAGGGVFV